MYRAKKPNESVLEIIGLVCAVGCELKLGTVRSGHLLFTMNNIIMNPCILHKQAVDQGTFLIKLVRLERTLVKVLLPRAFHCTKAEMSIIEIT